MNRAPVELRVGGQSYRVVASADEAELRHLAGIVDARLRALVGAGRAITPQSMLLVALALANDVEEERAQRRRVEARSKEAFASLLERIDAALEAAETPAPPPVSPREPDSPEP